MNIFSKHLLDFFFHEECACKQARTTRKHPHIPLNILIFVVAALINKNLKPIGSKGFIHDESITIIVVIVVIINNNNNDDDAGSASLAVSFLGSCIICSNNNLPGLSAMRVRERRLTGRSLAA